VTYAAAQEQYTEIAFRALDVDAANLALGHETFEACGATFVRNRAYPLIYDANHVAAISASTPEEIDRLLARVEREYDHTAHREFGIDFRTPPAFVARLLLEGFERRDSLVMVLNGELRARPPDIEIRRVQTEDDWRDYAALRELDWREHKRRIKKAPEPAVGESLYSVARLKHWNADTTGPALSLSSLTPRIRRNRCTPPWASGPSLCTRITSRGFQRHSAPGNFVTRPSARRLVLIIGRVR